MGKPGSHREREREPKCDDEVMRKMLVKGEKWKADYLLDGGNFRASQGIVYDANEIGSY